MSDGTKEDLYAQVGAQIRALRKARGLTMQEVVNQGYVGATAHLSHLERGHVKPALVTLVRLAECFEVPVQDLLPPRPLDRTQLLERVQRLDDGQARALDGVLCLLERDG